MDHQCPRATVGAIRIYRTNGAAGKDTSIAADPVTVATVVHVVPFVDVCTRIVAG